MDRQIDNTESFELNADQQPHPTLAFESPAPSDEIEAEANPIRKADAGEVVSLSGINGQSRNEAEVIGYIGTGYIAPVNSFEMQISQEIKTSQENVEIEVMSFIDTTITAPLNSLEGRAPEIERPKMEVEDEQLPEKNAENEMESDLQSPKSRSDFGEDVGEGNHQQLNGEEKKDAQMIEYEVASIEISQEEKELTQSPVKIAKKVKTDMLKGNEKELNDIAAEYESEMHLLSQQPTLSQLQKSLEDLCQAFTIDHDEKDSLEKRIEKAVEWATNYLKALEKNQGELGELIDEVQTIQVRLDEMEKALEYRKEWRLWRLKIIKINSSLEKKVEDIFEEASLMVSFEDLKEVFDEEKIIQHIEPDDGLFQRIKQNFEEVRKIRTILREEQSIGLDQLIDIKEKLHNLNVSIPELSSLHKKLVANLDSHMEVWKEDSQMIVESEIQRDSKDQKEYSQTQDDLEKLIKVQQERERLAEWKKAVGEFLALNYEENLLKTLENSYPDQVDYEEKQKELADVVMKARHLDNWHDYDLNVSVELTQEKKGIQKVSRLAVWISNALGMRQQIEGEQLPLNYENIKGIVDEMNELRLPKDKGLCIMMVGWYDQIEDVRRRYIREYQQKRRLNSTSNVENARVKSLIAQNIDKIDLTEAENMLEILKGIENLTMLREEIQTVTIDIKSYQAWRHKIKAALEESETLMDNVQKEDTNNNQIEREAFKILNELKAQMMLMPLKDVKDEKDLLLLEWIFRVSFLIGCSRKDCEFEDWKKLLWEADTLGTENTEKIVRLKDLIIIELGKSNKIKMFLERLKVIAEGQNQQETNDDNKVSLEELNQAVKDCEECKIALKEEKRELERFSNKYKSIKDRFKKLLYPEREKAVLREFTSLQEHIIKFPIEMSKEYKLLNDAVIEATTLEGDSKVQVWDNFETMEDLIDRYKKCPVFINGIAKMEKIYEEIKQRYDKVKSKEEAVLEDGNTLTFEELEDLTHELEKLEDNKVGSSFTKLKKRIYIKKIQLLQDQHSGGFEKGSITIPYRHLYSLWSDGRDLKKQFADDKELNTLCFFIESVLKEADKRLADIEKLKDAQKLDQMSSVILKFVDISEQIIERKASLTCEKTKTQEIHYIDYEKDYRQSKGTVSKERETSAKKKGRPRKGEERTPKKEREENSNDMKRLSKERSREIERTIIATSKVTTDPIQAHTKSWVRVAPEEKPIKKLTQYFEPKKESEMLQGLMKTTLKDNHPVLTIFAEILEACEVVKIRSSDSFDFAREIIKAVPQTIVSRDTYNDIKRKLKSILEYRYITQSLVKKRFDNTVLKNLFQKDQSSYKNIDRGLKEKKSRDISRTPDKAENEVINKKNKKTAEKEFERDRSHSELQKAKNEKLSTPKYEVKSIQKKTLRNEDYDDTESFRFKSTGDKSTFTSAVADKKASVARSSLMSTKKNLIFDDEKSISSSTKKKTPVYEIELPAKKLELADLKPAKKKDLPSYKEDSLSPKHWEKEDSGLLYHGKFNDKNGKESNFGKKSVQSNLSYQIQRKAKDSERYDPEDAVRERRKETMKTYESEAKSSKLERLERLQRLEKKEVKQTEMKEEKEYEKEPGILEGTILRIFEGSFEFDKDKPSQKIALFTCDSYDKASKIPLLGPNGEPQLEVHMKLPKAKVEAYLNSILIRKEDGGVNLVSGWIESRISLYQSRCDHIAKELLDSDQMATISYDGSSRIIIMHKNQMHNEWKNQLNFRLRKVQKTSNPTLYFVITSKTRKLKNDVKFIEPIAEPKSEKAKNGFERDDSLSAASSIEDYEQDFGAEVDEKSSLTSVDKFDNNTMQSKQNYSKNKSQIQERTSRKNEWAKRKSYDFEEEDDNNFESGVDVNKRNFKEFNKRHVSFDVEEDQIVKKRKVDEISHKRGLVEKLRVMESEEIIEYAKSLDPEDRETIMNILANMGMEEEDFEEMTPHSNSNRDYSSFSEEEEEDEDNIVPSRNYREENSHTYRPPFYIQKIYNLFTKEQLRRAQNMLENGPQYQSIPSYEPTTEKASTEIYQPFEQEEEQRIETDEPAINLDLDHLNGLNDSIQEPQSNSSILTKHITGIDVPQQQVKPLFIEEVQIKERVEIRSESENPHVGKIASKKSPSQLESTILQLEQMQMKLTPHEIPYHQTEPEQPVEQQITNNESLITETTTLANSNATTKKIIQPTQAPANHQNSDSTPSNVKLPVKIQYKGVNTKLLKNPQHANKKPAAQPINVFDAVINPQGDETEEKDLICGVKLQGNNLKIPKAVWEALSVLATQPLSQLMTLPKSVLGSVASKHEAAEQAEQVPINENKEPEVNHDNDNTESNAANESNNDTATNMECEKQ